MKKSEINVLKEINEELKDTWKQNQKKISEIESEYPDFKNNSVLDCVDSGDTVGAMSQRVF